MNKIIKLNKVVLGFPRKGSKGKPELVAVALCATSSSLSSEKSPTGTERENPKKPQVVLK